MKLKLIPLAAVLLATVTLLTYSCKKNTDVVADPVIEQNYSIPQLAARFTEPIGNDFAAVKKEYSSFNEDDLKIFWLNIFKIQNQKYKNSMSETSFLTEIEALNNESKSRFGIPMNKISGQNSLKGFNNDRNPLPSFVDPNRPPPPPPPSCEFLPYPEFYYKDYSTPYSGPANSWRIVDYYPGDCNGIEMTYNGFYNRLRPITPLGDIAVNLFLQGDHITVNGIVKTRELHKLSSVMAIFHSYPQGIDDNLRMSKVLIVQE